MTLNTAPTVAAGLTGATWTTERLLRESARRPLSEGAPMIDEPDDDQHVEILQSERWLQASPNARLAIYGLILFALDIGVTIAMKWIDQPVFDGQIYRYPSHAWYGEFLLAFVGISLLVGYLAAPTIIIFAAYRAIRDRGIERI
jgi:hypothetical protein